MRSRAHHVAMVFGFVLVLFSISEQAFSQLTLECANDQALPLPLEIVLNEGEKSGTVKMQYSRHTKCEFLASNWVYGPNEIYFEFNIDLEDCAKHLTPLKALLDRREGVLRLSPAQKSGDVITLACARTENGNKF